MSINLKETITDELESFCILFKIPCPQLSEDMDVEELKNLLKTTRETFWANVENHEKVKREKKEIKKKTAILKEQIDEIKKEKVILDLSYLKIQKEEAKRNINKCFICEKDGIREYIIIRDIDKKEFSLAGDNIFNPYKYEAISIKVPFEDITINKINLFYRYDCADKFLMFDNRSRMIEIPLDEFKNIFNQWLLFVKENINKINEL